MAAELELLSAFLEVAGGKGRDNKAMLADAAREIYEELGAVVLRGCLISFPGRVNRYESGDQVSGARHAVRTGGGGVW